MTEELKPCPFCGGEAKVVSLPPCYDISGEYKVACTRCSANVWFLGSLNEGLKLAIREKWNRRVNYDRDNEG